MGDVTLWGAYISAGEDGENNDNRTAGRFTNPGPSEYEYHVTQRKCRAIWGTTCTVKCPYTDLYAPMIESITGPMFAFAIVLSGRFRHGSSWKVHAVNHTNFFIYQCAFSFSSLCGVVYRVSTPGFLQLGCSQHNTLHA
jgi:hypothetical protein